MTTQIGYSKKFNKHNMVGHPENAQRLDVLFSALKKVSFYDQLSLVEPKLLPEEKLFSIHSEEMVQLVKDASLNGSEWLDLDTYVSKSDFDTACLAAGCAVQIASNVTKGEANNGYCLVRPPGHHATRSRSMGFCLFNNIALAANEITRTGKKVLIFDSDTHHGNGTQDIFYDRCDVMYQSFHLFPHYPGTGRVTELGMGEGEGYTINAPLSHGNGNEAVTQLLEHIFLPVAEQFQPDIILMSTGYDSHHSDPLGGLKLTSNFYGEIIAKFQHIQPRIVCTLEGGYNLSYIDKCMLSQIGQLMDKPIIFDDTVQEHVNVEMLLQELKKEIGRFWDVTI